ncbi:MAG TPA: hypothetical protein VG754_10295 [Verrucomicrobiae bacterium]|nr:hypothetical protein [Verrucomicrobiae bacterium]
MKKIPAPILIVLSLICVGQFTCQAWDYEGHRLVNQLALTALPTDFPAFVKTPEARERIAFLAGEPDRWRGVREATLDNANAPDHYIDLEQLADYDLDEHSLTHFRNDFTAQLALARAAHPERFKPIDPDQNRDHTRQLVGFLPWAINENFFKLKEGFSYLKAFETGGGTQAEIANARQDIIYIMGVMGHYVGDAAQPLHTTKHFSGWVGDNPQNYTREHIHSRVDSYFRHFDHASFEAVQARMHPARLPADEESMKSGDTFDAVMAYILEQNKKVVPLYGLEKSGKLFGKGDAGEEGKVFLTQQLQTGGQMLADLWFAAWQQAAPDSYLQSQLAQRKLAEGGTKN